MNVHPSRAVSSSGCANFGLLKTAQDGESEFGEDTTIFLRNYFNVDEGLKSVNAIWNAINLFTKSKAGLRLLNLQATLLNF